MEIRIEPTDTFEDVLQKCIAHFLQGDASVAEMGYLLASEAIELLARHTSNPHMAYTVLFSALKRCSHEAAMMGEAENEVSDEAVADLQNAPSTRTVQ